MTKTVFNLREQTLHDAMQTLYAVFRIYKLPPHIEPDPCFPNCCDDRPLRAAPLHLLPAEAFRWYQWKAITTWGNVDDFKHFLPRMLELVTTQGNEEARVDASFVFAKLKYGGWQRWPAREREALVNYIDALSALRLTWPRDRDFSFYGAGEWLRDLSELYADLSPVLNRWEQLLRDAEFGVIAGVHLADMIDRERGHLLKTAGLNWHEAFAAQEQQLLNWLASEEVIRLVEAAFFRAAETPQAAALSEAHHLLGWLRTRHSATM